MIRATITYGILLVGLLGAAWMEWTKAPQIDRGNKVELLPGSADDITEIRWKSDKSEAVVARRSDERGAYFWVDYTRWTTKKEAAPAPEDGAETDDGAEATEERTEKRSAFKAGDKMEEVLTNLSPMLALRRLEVSDADKLEEIGLSEPTAVLEIVRGSRTQSLEVGGEAYGSRDIYVRKTADQQIYLVERELLQTLKYARSRLADHSLFGMDRKNIASATITTSTGTVSVEQRNADDPDKAQWVRVDAPDQVAEQITTWMGKAFKLKSMRYADPANAPEGLEARFQLTLTDAAQSTERLEVFQIGADGDWYGRSEHTRGLVKLVRSAAKALSDDSNSLIAD